MGASVAGDNSDSGDSDVVVGVGSVGVGDQKRKRIVSKAE